MKVTFSALLITAAALVSSACLAQNGDAANARPTQETDLPKIDDAAWRYQAQDGVFCQLVIPYCRTPADAEYETLAIFVPKEYMTATDNGNGTFTCKANPSGRVGAYTAADAPVAKHSAENPRRRSAAATSSSRFVMFILLAACLKAAEADARAGTNRRPSPARPRA